MFSIQLESCCCITSLKTGTKIIGWFLMICSIIIVMLSIFGLIAWQPRTHSDRTTTEQKKEYVLNMRSDFLIAVGSTLINCMLLVGVYQINGQLIKCFKIVIAITRAPHLIHIASHVLLRLSSDLVSKDFMQKAFKMNESDYTSKTNKKILVLAYAVIIALSTVFYITQLCFFLFLMPYPVLLFIGISILGLEVYIFLIVYSYYNTMVDETINYNLQNSA